MSKRKRSEDQVGPIDFEQSSESNLTQFSTNGFTRPSIPYQRTHSSVSNTYQNDDALPVSAQSTSIHSGMEVPWKAYTSTGSITQAVDSAPGISRKITACTACRKQKIKCEMTNDTPPCTRCARRGINCVLNKSLQTLLEETKQNDLFSHDIYNLHETLDAVCRTVGVQPPRPLSSNMPSKTAQDAGAVSSDNEQECELSPPSSPSGVQAPIDTFLEATKLTSPLSPDTPQSLRHHRSHVQHDLIAKNIISMPAAEALMQRYFSRLDHFLYGIGSSWGDLKTVRETSPVLTAAICTVSALHDPRNNNLYESCNREFRRLVSRSVFEKCGLDHLQALCVGSFWLTDASRILSSDALRRAADARIHRHFQLLLNPETNTHGSNSTLSSTDHVSRVRLWYLLFICDQHLSILHNRDPLLRTDKEITADWESFLNRENATDSDVRLMSQVALLLIMGQVRDTFGSELDEKLGKGSATQIVNFSKQLDKWYARFSKLFKPNPNIGNFPMKGLSMHYQYGKLYLGHHLFKGLKGEPIPVYFLSSASIARDAAIEIFDMIYRDTELQSSLVGMPHYFHIMIAFAGNFLFELCKKYHEQLSIDLDHTFDLVGKVLTLFSNLPCIPQHPISRMTSGLAKKLFDCAAAMNRSVGMDYQPFGLQEMLSGQTNDQYLVNSQTQTFQPSNGNQFPMEMIQPAMGANDLFFSDFEQFTFPELAMNFMT